MRSREKLSFKAIFIGWFLIANLLSAVLNLLIRYAAELILGAQGYDSRQAGDLLADAMDYRAFELCWEWVFTGLGGYAAARLAGREEMRHARRVGSLNAVGGVVFLIIATVFFPGIAPGGHVISILGSVPAAMAGGYMRRRQV